ncbi:MAG TPA: metallopeptidase TldD-related protein [Thermoanaerobaculia bacterium]|nr:metallopeptidase TldD-related protein [Thermoanaerobaculia bacterium]
MPPFSSFDTAALSRSLAQIAEQPDDLLDAYFERIEEVELPPEGEGPGLAVRREEGFAVRLVRAGRTYMASRDGIDGRAFSEALRQVARALPAASMPEPSLALEPWQTAAEAPEVIDFPGQLQRALRAHHVAFPLRLTVRRHRRAVQVAGPRLVPAAEEESFYSLAAEIPAGRWGALFPRLGKPESEEAAAALVELFRSRSAHTLSPRPGPVLLGPAVVAVLLHEAVAHALEADLLALSGSPGAAIGVSLGAPALTVLDDPGSAPESVKRATDDEGLPVCRRWLLRDGKVEQPLADAYWAGVAPTLLPGAARRGDRHLPPAPRSHHLELLAGAADEADLFAAAEGGLYLPQVRRGALEVRSGEFVLALPFARRIYKGEPAESFGPCTLRGRVADLLGRVVQVGAERRPGGAGWCAKGGQKLPVWATAPALLLDGVEVAP